MNNLTNTTPNNHNKFIGYLGETEAIKLLKKTGHTIIRRNYQNRFGEIDIISLNKNKTLCFSEVKTVIRKSSETRKSFDGAHRPEDNLSERKIGNMMRAIELYLQGFPADDPYWEANAITLELDTELSIISSNLIENINI